MGINYVPDPTWPLGRWEQRSACDSGENVRIMFLDFEVQTRKSKLNNRNLKTTIVVSRDSV